MKVEPTGIVLVDTCGVQTERCLAREPAAITAVWTLPGRIQINVCRPCLEEQVRSGEWEIQSARIETRADVAVYSADKRLMLVVEVKSRSKANKNLREWATLIHRNLIAHAGIPSAPYFLVAILPGSLYLWKHSDSFNIDRGPDYEVDAQGVLGPYFKQLLSLGVEDASGYHLESLMTSWLKDVVNGAHLDDPSLGWLQDSGLYQAIANGSVVMQAPVAA